LDRGSNLNLGVALSKKKFFNYLM